VVICSTIAEIFTDSRGSLEKCRHLIGAGADKVCFNERRLHAEICGITHRGDKVAFEPDALYVRLTPKQILLGPFVPCIMITEEFVERLLDMSQIGY
jgi:hypothetical protein